MQKYAFIDRDGTLIWEYGRDQHNVAFPPKTVEEVKFMDGAIEGLQQLQKQSYKLVLVTNQSYLGTPRNPERSLTQ